MKAEESTMNTPIIFNLSIGGKKPHSSTQKICPFCHPETLTNILDKKDGVCQEFCVNRFNKQHRIA
ncbi:DUF4931 domain-containing protein, partial [Phocaeicola coprocola]|uniref:DUF4931 domain-containing protein n=1 Tax=Phocaeicola coprocola TaxID=310298 RepID=UPI0039F5442C